jgi:hypothetical protein
MPEWAMLEMVADWLGASRAYEGKWPGADWPWLQKNWNKIRLASGSRAFVGLTLEKLGIRYPKETQP